MMSAVTLNTPIVTPTPTASAPSGPRAKSGVIWIRMPAAVK
jgi:hypothetical protein